MYVPAEALETYEDSEWWDFFKEIKPIEGTVDPEPQWDGRCMISYKDKDSALLDSEELIFHAPAAPEIEGFTFIKWQASGDTEEGIVLQAVYEADKPTSAPVVVNPANKAQKLIRNGNVYILTDSKTYTVTGVEMK